MSVRLAHFSDIHLTAKPLGWRVRDAFNKRSTGWANLTVLGRGAKFKHANDVTAALRREFASRGFDHLVFSGDASTLGFPSEMTEAARRLGVGDATQPQGIAVPGNHDVYVGRSARDRLFEEAFAAWQHGQRVGAEHYPFARKVGHVWLIGLNSAKPNFLLWDASGRVGGAQLQRFRELCKALDDGPRIVVSHYPLLMENHRPEPRWHRLLDWAAVRDAAAECGVGLWLHGHRHHWYVLPAAANLPFPTICTGSSTQAGRWGYHDYTLDGWQLKAVRRVYDQTSQSFIDSDTFELELPKTPPAPLPDPRVQPRLRKQARRGTRDKRKGEKGHHAEEDRLAVRPPFVNDVQEGPGVPWARVRDRGRNRGRRQEAVQRG